LGIDIRKGLTDGGFNWNPAHIPPRELREVFLRPFEAAVREAGLYSIMNGYNELDGVPCAASHELLMEILREQWGFEGLVVSDYFAVDQLQQAHLISSDKGSSARMALQAGIDVELPSTDCYGEPLRRQVEQGKLDVAVIDTSVARVLRTEFQLGLFENPFVEVVQFYVRNAAASVTRPLKELAGFCRVHLMPGERRTVTLDLAVNQLAFLDRDMRWVVEPGQVRVMAGQQRVFAGAVRVV